MDNLLSNITTSILNKSTLLTFWFLVGIIFIYCLDPLLKNISNQKIRDYSDRYIFFLTFFWPIYIAFIFLYLLIKNYKNKKGEIKNEVV